MRMIQPLVLGALLALLGLLTSPRADELLPGPVPAEVEVVVDGDTLEVRAQIWLDQEVRTLVRLEGIDAPELRGKCPSEKTQALAAKAWLVSYLTASSEAEVLLFNISYEKYAGRVLATVQLPTGENLSDLLLAEGLVRAYSGGKRQGWCD